jgi:hypothetical protein
MSDPDHDWIDALERTHRAVREFARSEFSAYARKIVYRMQRFPASGTYGCDVKHKTLWDEFCYETQNGPLEELRRAWDQTLGPNVDEMIQSIPATTAVLLSIFSCWELEGSLDLCRSLWPDGMKEVLKQSLIKEAMSRSQK